jgi:hypothetical protein
VIWVSSEIPLLPPEAVKKLMYRGPEGCKYNYFGVSD